MLQSAGLITLKSGGTIFSDLADVDESAVEGQGHRTRGVAHADLAARRRRGRSSTTTSSTTPASTSDDAIAQDDPTDPNALPYVNIFATRAEDADNATYKKLVEIFQTDPEVQAGLLEASGGTAVAVQTPVADLEKSLTKVEADTKAAKG